MHTWAEILRLPLVFAAAADALAGVIISGGRWDRATDIVALVIASAAFWAASGPIGDWYTWKDDLIRRPLKPIPSKRINRWHALSIGVVLLATGATLAGAPGASTTSRIAMLLVATILLSRVILRHAPAALLLEILYRPFNFLMGLVFIPLAVSPANSEFRCYLLTCLGFYAITLVLLEEHEIHGYRPRVLTAIAAPAVLAGLGIATLPVLFAAAVPSWLGTAWACSAIAWTGFRLAQAALTPSGTTVSNALRAATFGSILLAAAATAFAYHPWASLLVAAMLAPAWWATWYLDPRRAAIPAKPQNTIHSNG